MGQNDEECLRKACIFISKLEMLTELCVYNPDRVIDLDGDKKKKKKNDLLDEDQVVEAEEDEFEFLNTS